MILQNQIQDSQDRRRIQGSTYSYHCFGGNGGGYSYTYLPSCTTIVLIKSGSLVDALQFLSQGYETRYYGGSGGGTYVLVAPRGRCLGDIKMKTGSLVDRICLRFNA